MEVELHEDRIRFPKGYFCKHSTVHQSKEITLDQINEVNLLTQPLSVVIDHKEVIFLPQISKEELASFARRNQLKISERFDIWEAINEPYLDTEFSKEQEQATIQALIHNGVSEEEVKGIRKKISLTMSMNMFAWEWVYLGQFDYLSWSLRTKKKYWWSMEIALRNYQKDTTHQ
ncbi:MAG: hypothetical protein AAFO03_10235 [Bacteroidota bacterium]